MLSLSPMFRVAAFTTCFRKPEFCAAIRYSPGISDGNRYTPEALDLVAISTPVLVLVAVTEAPAIAAPVGSVTVPERTASVLCANARAAQRQRDKTTFMYPL